MSSLIEVKKSPFYLCYCLFGAKETWPLFTEWFKMTMNDSSDISFIVVANILNISESS